ncbi:hypothetical protein R3P38DRAFT_2804569 [Favolaschia claudopus]|uniref:mRNA 3'-end-processing protein RNA14 n=1 Tax=Favolaschia claudopus TaxID=2862362 RepID=A0AAV9ZQ57_9AGAR
METFGGDASYVLSYLSFLLRINLQQNARDLFERVIATFSPEEAKPIWDCWSESLYEYDNLEAVLQTESRIAEIYPNDSPLKRFGRRHVYRGTDPIADHDLGFAHVKAQAANSIHCPSEHKRIRLAGSDQGRCHHEKGGIREEQEILKIATMAGRLEGGRFAKIESQEHTRNLTCASQPIFLSRCLVKPESKGTGLRKGSLSELAIFGDWGLAGEGHRLEYRASRRHTRGRGFEVGGL